MGIERNEQNRMLEQKMQKDKLGVDDSSFPLEKKWSVLWTVVDRHHHPIAAGHATSMKHQEMQWRKLWRLGVSQDWDSCSEDDHAYVPSVDATMVVEELGWWTATDLRTSIIKGQQNFLP